MLRGEFGFVESLKLCARTKDLHRGSKLHGDVVRKGLLDKNPHIATTLISMYAQCGALTKAQQVLEDLAARDVAPWNALISGYARHGQSCEALNCLERMQREGVSPNAITFTCALKACGSMGDLRKGRQIHDEITVRGFLAKDALLGNALIDMYARCGQLGKAEEVLEALALRNVVTWNTLIAGYAQQERGHEALQCFKRMLKDEGLISPDGITFTCVLKACGSTRSFEEGKRIHEEIAGRGLLRHNAVLGNALVDMYAKCGALEAARHALEELPIRNVVSWSALIDGYAQAGQGYEALKCFDRMKQEGHSPNAVTFVSVLKACASMKDADRGKQVHDEIVGNCDLEKSIALGNALVDMYVKCGALSMAKRALEELSVRDIVSWSALIAGYAQEGKGHEALDCYEQMQREGLLADDVTFVCALKATANVKAVEKGMRIHREIVRRDLVKKNGVLGNALVDMYAKCGMLAKARKVLEELHAKDVVAWNALLAGCIQQEQSQEALSCFQQMQREGITPNGVTFTCILKACSSIGAINKGKQIHDEILSRDLLAKNLVLGTALVDMYAQCGHLAKAQEVLQALHVRDVVAWSTLIAGYAQKGQVEMALQCFAQMQKEGLSPDDVTFVSVLNACGHSGKLDEAQAYYENMKTKYGITPKIEHHTCMVVVFGYMGRFDKAMSVLRTMPSPGDPSVWVALLSACRKRGNVKLGKLAFEQAIELDRGYCAAYVLMASIYLAAGMQEDAEIVEAMRLRHVT
jgi:pentatricopeptide repeat protein